MKKLSKVIGASILTVGCLLTLPAKAAEVPSTINWTIPFGVGGGTDVWARFIAPHLTKNIEGNPTVVIKNQPGGGSITGTNLFYQRAKSNGEDILGTSASTLYPFMLGDKRVRYNFDKWIPLMASPTGGVVYVQPDLGVSSANDIAKLNGVTLPFGSQSPTGLELPVFLAFEMLGLDIKPVFGMKSRGAGRLAFERGEAKIDFQTSSAYMNSVLDLVQNNKAVPLFSLGILNAEGKIVRDPAFPDLPTFEEVYAKKYGKEPSGMEYTAYKKFLAAGFAFQKVIFIPADTPSDVMKEYQTGIQKMLKDPAFIKDSEVQIGPYENVMGIDAAQYLSEAVTVSPELYSWISNWLKTKFDYKL
ncbi:tricarboxylate transporter [Marinomonas sp. UCMA 3892]|jgi:tripartite-type tricarboxylate transporter receptor subunit TctC|uniref:Bug family tripartite tricarboxylate transporter substrate binding protein n=1 Tax=unclassified Marinomonas TaxID=196814 RepID=UPI00146E5CAB|nr:tricarboxylate transporter [Marinomonas sp. UCMA 3892]NLU99781.1 tricarboxylate transporter [Marinomonas sp. UCMA 3892]